MNYRHAYHAGNFADVAKHLALVAVLLHLRKKDKGFAVIDSHGGRGHYDLGAESAQKTGEAEAGIVRLGRLAGRRDLPEALSTYLALATREAGHYPGSPLIAAELLRPQDRLVAIEKHPEEAHALTAVLAPFAKAQVVEGDGYARLAALLPPPERRGLILIDPPYEAAGEFEIAARAVTAAFRRFQTGIFLLWFPIKSPAAAAAFCGEVLATGVQKALRIDIAVPVEPAPEGRERMGAAGLLVINPSFGLDGEMKAAGEAIGPLLGARLTLAWLAGEAA